MPTAGLGAFAPIKRLKQFTALILASGTLIPRSSQLQYISRNWPDEWRKTGKNLGTGQNMPLYYQALAARREKSFHGLSVARKCGIMHLAVAIRAAAAASYRCKTRG
ncbi:MAG TPA: hypothetical protein VJS85_08980 [Rhizomicrobium sp.]|nr:hypothetical protein [Rhizomicrobium sp.]